VAWLDCHALAGMDVDPTLQPPPARKNQCVMPSVINNREFEITVVWCACYGFPHAHSKSENCDPAIDLDQNACRWTAQNKQDREDSGGFKRLKERKELSRHRQAT
jgi:hypothetical protein